MTITKAKILIAKHLKDMDCKAWRYYNWHKDSKGNLIVDVRLAVDDIFRTYIIDKNGEIDSYIRH